MFCPFQKGLTCESCAGHIAIKIKLGDTFQVVNCVRMAVDLMMADASQRNIIPAEKIERLIRKIEGE